MTPYVSLLIGRQCQIVQVSAELSIDEKSGRALTVSNRIHAIDGPRGRLRLSRRPCLAPDSNLAVRHVLDAQLEVVPRIWFPGERNGHRASCLRLPGFKL